MFKTEHKLLSPGWALLHRQLSHNLCSKYGLCHMNSANRYESKQRDWSFFVQWSWNNVIRTTPTRHVRQTVPTDYNTYDQCFHFKPLWTNKQKNKWAFSILICVTPHNCQLHCRGQQPQLNAEDNNEKPWSSIEFRIIINHQKCSWLILHSGFLV